MRSNRIISRGNSPIVLHVVQSLRGGGAETFVRELLPRLRQRGIDARALCAYGTSGLTEEETQAWSGTVYCTERSRISKFAYLLQIRRVMQQVAPDIVHTHTHVGATWGRAAAVMARVPRLVHTEHRSVESLSIPERVAAVVLNRRTDALVTFSERTAEMMRVREGVHDVCIIPNGVAVQPSPTFRVREESRGKLGIDPRCVVVGVIANLHAHKNPDLAIEALARLPPRLHDIVQLALMGEGPLLSYLKDRAQALGVQERVKFLGFRTDLVQLLPGLDIVLTLSRREMMPMSLLEAMNASLPIIGTPHLGTLDLVVDMETGIVVHSWDPARIAGAIEWATENPQWRLRAGAAAHARLASNFDIESVATQYANLYRHLLQ